jgi:hypothetical protein
MSWGFAGRFVSTPRCGVSCFAPLPAQNAGMSTRICIRSAVPAFRHLVGSSLLVCLLVSPGMAEQARAAEAAAAQEAATTPESTAADPAKQVSEKTPAADEIVNAIWKDQEFDFLYRSSTNIYSCSAMRSRVKSVLRAIGADKGLEVSVTGCEEFIIPTPEELEIPPVGRGPQPSNSAAERLRERQRLRPRESQFARVRIKMRSPIPATPEALAELEKTKPYRELLGRVTGKDTLQEAAAQFPARRQQISLSTRKLDLEPEECELIEQMITEVFPKLQVRVVKKNISCFPPRVSKLKPRLEVEALVKAPGK